jgi:hypothetical protein
MTIRIRSDGESIAWRKCFNEYDIYSTPNSRDGGGGTAGYRFIEKRFYNWQDYLSWKS